MITYSKDNTTLTIHTSERHTVVVLTEKEVGMEVVRWYEISNHDYYNESTYNMIEFSKSLSKRCYLHNAVKRLGVEL